MKKSIRQFLVLGVALFVLGALTPAHIFADVSVYAEGAYTASDLVVYIYTDIDVSPAELRSAGVKLTYEVSELTVGSADKNEDIWFLGSSPYMEPDTSIPGEVILILGKLDTATPTAGVTGNRVLLGKVIFNRIGSTMPFSPTLSLGLGKTGNFANFVDTGASVLDGGASLSFGSIIVAERGDANADDVITNMDMFEVKNMLSAGGYVVYADCNDDEVITNMDMFCIKGKL